MKPVEIQSLLERESGLRMARDVSLHRHTSIGIGGPAALFAQVDDPSALAILLSTAVGHSIPVFILGGGTNLLVSDDGFYGLVIRPAFDGLKEGDGWIRAGAAVPAAGLVAHAVERGLGGLAFAAGLPGTVGGAVAGNAGCFGSSFGERLRAATIVTADGRVEEVKNEWFEFDYRHSAVARKGAVIVDVTLSVAPGDVESLRRTAEEHIALRRTKHPAAGTRTAGSWFKNLPPLSPGEFRRPAGALLEQVGARGECVGDAVVFEKHANIFVNRGSASAADMLALERRLRERVEERFGECLETEVRFVGNRPVLPEAGSRVQA